MNRKALWIVGIVFYTLGYGISIYYLNPQSWAGIMLSVAGMNFIMYLVFTGKKKKKTKGKGAKK